MLPYSIGSYSLFMLIFLLEMSRESLSFLLAEKATGYSMICTAIKSSTDSCAVCLKIKVYTIQLHFVRLLWRSTYLAFAKDNTIHSLRITSSRQQYIVLQLGKQITEFADFKCIFSSLLAYKSYLTHRLEDALVTNSCVRQYIVLQLGKQIAGQRRNQIC